MCNVRSRLWHSSLALVVSMLAFASAVSSIHAEALRAGVAVEDITRDDPTSEVHDPLRAKSLVFDDGASRIAIVCLDIGGASSTLVSNIRARLNDQLGFDESQVLINASHNHHTQGQVAGDIVERCVKAVRRASETLVPVKIGVGVGCEDRIMMNRRLRLEDGRQWTIRRANPSPQDAEVTGLGPVDTEIGILRVDKLSGRPLAVLYNFAGHAYGGVPNGAVTADFPGFASAVIEQALGHGAVALFLQGAAGDITPIRYKDVDAPPPTEQLGTMLGLSTLKAFGRIPTQEAATVHAVSKVIELPRRQDVERRIQSLEAEQEEILQFFTGVGCGTHGAGTFLNFKTFLPLYMKQLTDPDHPSYASYLYRHEAATERHDLEHLDQQNKQRVDKYLASIQQMERLIRIRSNLKILGRHLTRGGGPEIAAEVQGIRIGEFVLVTFPGELFAEVALRMKHQSPCKHTFVAAYSNGHLGYAPTADAYDAQAYEDCLTPFAPQWQEIYEQKALEIIRRLTTNHGKPSIGRTGLRDKPITEVVEACEKSGAGEILPIPAVACGTVLKKNGEIVRILGDINGKGTKGELFEGGWMKFDLNQYPVGARLAPSSETINEDCSALLRVRIRPDKRKGEDWIWLCGVNSDPVKASPETGGLKSQTQFTS